MAERVQVNGSNGSVRCDVGVVCEDHRGPGPPVASSRRCPRCHRMRCAAEFFDKKPDEPLIDDVDMCNDCLDDQMHFDAVAASPDYWDVD